MFDESRAKAHLKTFRLKAIEEWPRDSDEILLEIINNNKISMRTRQEAIEFASDLAVVDLKVVRAFCTIIKNSEESYELRSSAISGLSDILAEVSSPEYQAEIKFVDPNEDIIKISDFDEVRQLLQQIFYNKHEIPEIKRRALEVSATLPDIWHSEAIKEAYADGDVAWRLTALYCMRFVDGFEKEICQELLSRNADMQQYALIAVKMKKIASVWPQVRGIIEAERINEDVFYAALEAGIAINPQAMPEILTSLSDFDDPDWQDDVLAARELLNYQQKNKQDIS